MTHFDGELRQKYNYFLPQNNKITKVTMYYNQVEFIYGSIFHLSDGSNWEIGRFKDWMSTETVDIADNEVIVGFRAKSHFDYPAIYVEWQFITA